MNGFVLLPLLALLATLVSVSRYENTPTLTVVHAA
jgi:hypothetical protein